jgi:hypothetical protein
MSALGYTARRRSRQLEACEEHDVKLLVLDSLGPALQETRSVQGCDFVLLAGYGAFRAIGVGVLIIDHQSKLQAGQSYQSKGAFGSVYKNNLARSVIQVEATERGEGTLTPGSGIRNITSDPGRTFSHLTFAEERLRSNL